MGVRGGMRGSDSGTGCFDIESHITETKTDRQRERGGLGAFVRSFCSFSGVHRPSNVVHVGQVPCLL